MPGAGDPTIERLSSGFGGGRATDEEAAEAARQIALMASAGLPLVSGLNALASELPRQGLRSMLRQVARKLEDGDSLPEALDDLGPRFPAVLRGLLTAGARTGKLAESLVEFLDLHERIRTLRRQLWMSLIYPAILIVGAFAMFVGTSIMASQGFESVFADFGMDLPWITRIMLSAFRTMMQAGWWQAIIPVLGLALTWVTMRLTLDPAERVRVLHWIPLIGPLARNTALAQFCPVLGVLVESEIPLPEAIRLAGASARDSGLITSANEVAARVEQGQSLGEAVADRPPFPQGFGAFLSWAQENRGLVEALAMSAETFEARARAQAAFITRFCNVVAIVVVLWWLGLTVVALFLPLIQLLGVLGGMGPRNTGPDWVAVVIMGGLGVLGVVGVASVLAIVWRTRRNPAITSPTIRETPRPRTRFWYFAPAGWILLGVTLVVLLVLRLMNALGTGQWLPDWWLQEVWPMTEGLGMAVAMLAMLMLLFEFIASRVERARADRAERLSRRPARTRLRLPSFTFGLRHIMFTLAPLAVLMVMVKELGWSAVSIAGLMTPPIVVVSVFVILSARRIQNRDGLLQVMAMASRRVQPMGPAIVAFSQTCRGRYRRKLEDLALRLDSGDSLPQALDAVPGVLSRTGDVVARVGWQTGTLDRMLDDALGAEATRKASRVAAVGSIGYPLVVLSAIIGVGTFLMLYVSESFESIFRDFGVEMPEPSRTILNVVRQWLPTSNDVVSASLLCVAITFTAMFVGWIVWLIIRRAFDVIPLGDRFFRRLHAAVILRALAAGIETGQTLPAVLSRMAEAYPRRWPRNRLKRSVRKVDGGSNWAEALRSEGLISRVDTALVQSAERAGNLPWALREAASGGERRFTYHIQAIGQIVQPMAIVAMGLLVLMFALTYFKPLITLIDSLADVNL